MRYATRFQFGLTLLGGLFLIATIFAVLLYSVTPSTPAARGPLFLAALLAIVIGGLLCILFVLRWLLRPYRQLVGEAERAPVSAHIHKSKDEAAFVLETFQSVVAQLQEQREQLEQLSARARERADSAERFSERIIASVPSGLLAFDATGRSMVLNPPAHELIGVDGTALGQPFHELFANYPRLREMVEQCLATGRLYRREEIETTDGPSRRLGATVAPIDLSSEHGSRGALCLLTDITEVTQLREQVALKKNLENLGEMSAGLAHEFKNAIAALQGYVQLLQRMELGEKGRTTAASLLNEVRNLSEMVTSFLNFARPQPLELQPVCLFQLVSDCARELETVYNEHKVELTLDCPADVRSVEIRADERMLRQALLNLLRNAAEAIPEESVERKVQVNVAASTETGKANQIAMEIRDTGEGIPEAHLQKIFIPFFTTKSTGHGVGLALAHRVITEHGGTLTASNAPDGGAIFRLRMPV